MKKRLFCLGLLLLLICSFLGVTAYAAADEEQVRLAYVTDVTGSISESQRDSLSQLAEQISEQYSCGVYVVVVDNYEEYNSEGIEECAEGIYRFYDLGWGDQRDGVMLIMSMDQREYDIAAYGDFGNAAFTDYGKDYLAQSFLDDFRRNDWYSGFQDYLNTAASMLSSARQGEPVDIVWEERELEGPGPVAKLIMALLPSSVAAFFITNGDKRKMKTAVSKRTAEDYVVPGGVNLYLHEDRFLHRSRHVEVIQDRPRDSGGSHHGGGTTVHSSGFSHHSGKF